MRIALTRSVSPGIVQCELTHIAREPIDVDMARAQHAAYEGLLADLGCRRIRLPDAPACPDGVFVEDTAVVLEEVAVITHPGAASRRAETTSVAEALARYRPLVWIQPPATLDGGDVLVLGRTLYVGLSGRTNADGVDQLRRLVEPFGYRCRGIEVRGCLHLKSAVTGIGEESVLLNRAWVSPDPFAAFEKIDVDPAEPHAANALRVGDVVLFPAAFPRTGERLERVGLDLRTVDVAEFTKAEGGVTCCSIVFDL